MQAAKGRGVRCRGLRPAIGSGNPPAMEPNFPPARPRRPSRPRKRLESWKEIATYLRRDVTTVQRWEKREGAARPSPPARPAGHRLRVQPRTRRLAQPASAAARRGGRTSAPSRAGGRSATWTRARGRAGHRRGGAGGRGRRHRHREPAGRAGIAPGAPGALHDRARPRSTPSTSVAISSDGRAILYATGPLLHLRRLDAVQPQPLAGDPGGLRPVLLARRPLVRLLRRQRAEEDARHRRTAPDAGAGAPGPGRRRGAPAATSSLPPSAAPPSRGSPKPAATRSSSAGPTSARAGPRSAGRTCCPTDGTSCIWSAATTWTCRASTSATSRRGDASEDRRVVAADSNVFFGSGHIAFVRRGQLHAQPFDAVAGRTTGPAFPITERVDQDPYDDGFALFALSGNGVLTYRGGVTPDRQLRWFDRTGKVRGRARRAGRIPRPGDVA